VTEFSYIHDKKRNKLGTEKGGRLVHIHHNLRVMNNLERFGTLVFIYTQTGKIICFVKNQPIILYASKEFRICLKKLEILIKLIRVYL
jgi:thiamine pyrophosphokinase